MTNNVSLSAEIERSRAMRWPRSSAADLIDLAERLLIPGVALDVGADSERDVSDLIANELQRVVSALFPTWLPEAEAFDDRGGAAMEAIAALADAKAANTDLFGAYLLSISNAALCRTPPEEVGRRFPRDTVFRECDKLLRRAYRAERVVLILDLGENADDLLSASVQQTALSITTQSTLYVWIAGADLSALGRIPNAPKGVRPCFPRAVATAQYPVPRQPRVTAPTGKPNPLSETETRVEAFLRRCDWAKGRAWNANWSADPLSNPLRVDLLWEREKLVVELDGPDHLAAEKYSRDRTRDRQLQARGFSVLRFTNDEIAEDLARAASEIEQFLAEARSGAQG